MAAHGITTPQGATWTVRRRWVPRLGTETLWGRFHRRFRRVFDRLRPKDVDIPDPGCLELLAEGFVAGLAILVALLVAVFVVVPLLVAVVDVAIVLLLAALGVLGRIVLRRPWVVEAVRAGGDEVIRWHVVGWRASGEHRDRVAEYLASTGTVPPDGSATGRTGG